MPQPDYQLLWTLSGRFFGYRAGDDLYTRAGKHIGRFRGNEVFARGGEYLGEIRHDDRLASDASKSGNRWLDFASLPQRAPIAPAADAPPYRPEGRFADFPAPELF